MAENKPPPKQMRYNLRSSLSTNVVIPSPEPKRKQPIPKIVELMVLTDDCLLKIFESLGPTDLANVVHVNKRLKSLVKYYMQFKYNLEFNVNFDFATENGRNVNLDAARTFLCIFGGEMKTLTLSSGSFLLLAPKTDINRILPMVQEYCNLKELTIKDFGMEGLQQNFFKQLDSLTLDNCSVSREWCKMKQLKTLKLSRFIVRRWPLEYFPREFRFEDGLKSSPIKIPIDSFGGLKELQISDTNLENDTVATLIRLNPSLEKLSVTKSITISTGFFSALYGLNNLVEFEFKKQIPSKSRSHSKSVAPYHMLNLFALKKLKTLKLFYDFVCTQELMEGFLKEGIVLEHLELGGSNFNDKTADSIVKMTSLKVLKLNDMFGLNESELLTMATGLKALEELHVKTNANISQTGLLEIVREGKYLRQLKIDGPITPLDAETYQAMITVIQNRIERIGLGMTIYGDGAKSFMQNVVLDKGNEEWLSVEELDRSCNNLFDTLESNVSPNPVRSRYCDSDSDSE